MATVDAMVSIRVLDFLGDEVAKQIWVTLSDADTLADVVTDCHTIQTKLDSITDGEITGCKFELVVSLAGGLKAAPVVGSALNDNGGFNMRILNLSNRSFSDNVPTIAQSVIASGKINLTLPSIINWIALFTPGSTLAFMQPVTNLWLTLGSFRHSVLSTRKHRGQLSKTSFETP
jgi:hypothetical protein